MSLVISESSEHLGGPLGVSEVGDLLEACHFDDFFDHGREILVAHLDERVIPELFAVDVHADMLETVLVASIVSKPYVVTHLN